MAMDTIARGLAASVKKNLAENYYDKDQVDYLVDQIPKFSIEVVDELPTHDISETTIYMLRGEETGQDIYQEWIYVNGNWESLGVQESAFDEYYKKTETYNQTEIDNLISGVEVQYDTMPTASSSNLGQVVQYTGSTTQTYTNGYFYKCISDGGDPATYSWSQLNIQPAPDMSNYYTKSETYSKAEVDEAIEEIDLSNYYTKAEVYNKEETDEMIDGIEALIGDVNTVLASITTLPSMTTIAERLEEVVDVEETPGQNGGE